DIADSLDVGAAYLSDSVNRLSTQGFFEHLHSIRVLHASVLLAETADSIDVIAHRVGYLGAPHLTRHFRTILHGTPARFSRVCSFVPVRNPNEVPDKKFRN